MARQDRLTEDLPLKFWAIVDEAALHRCTGGDAVMRRQLDHLTEASTRPNVRLQVLPFSEGHHPGTTGSFSILDFDEELHSPVAYVISPAGDVYLERPEDMNRVTLTYTHLQTAALSAGKSRDLIAAIAKDLA